MTMLIPPCQLCGAPVQQRCQGHPGYQASTTYPIYHCSNCNTAFATPLAIDTKLYDLIYSLAAQIQGYDRYLDYAQGVLRVKDPLAYLAAAEDMYWAVNQHLEKKENKQGKLLEVGSGLGYLTYAIAQKGFDIQGIDISEKAVHAANKCYGPLFLNADIHAFAKTTPKRYQTVILTEVIEHIPDVKSFLASIDTLVVPGGEILITTPNKSSYGPDVLWETEPPPVHLWWFSETSLTHLAQSLGYEIEFIDFTAYNRYNVPHLVQTPHVPTRIPRLDSQGEIYYRDRKMYFKRHLVQALRKIGLLQVARQLQRLARGRQDIPSSRRETLCAVLKKRD